MWLQPIVLNSLIVLLSVFICSTGHAQSGEHTKEELTVDFEIRPRAEFKSNYRLSDKGDYNPELWLSLRNRIGINYRYKSMLFSASPQEIHLWNIIAANSSVGSINFYELYVEPHFSDHFKARIGRQGFLLDNGRIFSDAPWAQQSRSHEGIRLFYENTNITTDLMVASTRNYSNRFEYTWSPVASHNYKLLAVHHLKKKLNKNLIITTINYIDVSESNYASIANGGRIEYDSKPLYLTINGYYQWGKNQDSKRIRAYYLQPEMKSIFNKTTFRLGAEILSGESPLSSNNDIRSFGILYGVAWKFMGNMNFFTRFPRDVNGTGLVNPYLFIIHNVSKRLSLRADGNLFYTQHHLINPDKTLASRFLGFENDLSFEYKPTNNINIRYGFSYLIASDSKLLIGKVKNAGHIPMWSFLMVSFHPKLLHFIR